MIYLPFHQVCAIFHFDRGFGDKTEAELQALGLDLMMNGWDDKRPLIARRMGTEIFRHAVDGNHRLRALWHLGGWWTVVPVDFEEVT